MGADFLPSHTDPIALQIARFAADYGVAAGSVEGAWEALRRSGVAQPGLAFAAWVEAVALGGLLTPIVANCPDIGTALAELERFHPLLERDRIVLARWPRSASVTMCSPGGGPAHPDTVDAFFAVLCRMLRRLAGERALPSQVMLRRAAPARRDDYDNAFGVPIVFNQPADSCQFGANALRLLLTMPTPPCGGRWCRTPNTVSPGGGRRGRWRSAS